MTCDKNKRQRRKESLSYIEHRRSRIVNLLRCELGRDFTTSSVEGFPYVVRVTKRRTTLAVGVLNCAPNPLEQCGQRLTTESCRDAKSYYELRHLIINYAVAHT